MQREGADRLQLVPHRWYAWQMLPGYVDYSQPYYSPIYVTQVAPRRSDHSVLGLDFFNVLYLDGAQDFHLSLQILRSHNDFLVADLLYADEALKHVAIISRMGFGWLNQHCRHVTDTYPPSLLGPAAEKSVATYLDRAFPYVKARATLPR